ncbi:MAG: hypothetical protein FWH40_05055 [Coriobacteriia bacterium]|nr:hypothetical protein [Coriobacteriia bacterium]
MRGKSKPFLILLGIMLAFAMSGCKKPDDQPSNGDHLPDNLGSTEALSLEIIDSGYIIDEDGYVYYGIGVSNPNPDYSAVFFNVQVIGWDELGLAVFADSEIMTGLPAGEECYFASHAGNGTVPESVSFEVSVETYAWEKTDGSNYVKYEVADVSEQDTGLGKSYLGSIYANDEITAEEISVSVIYLYGDGSIISGDSAIVNIETSGEAFVFEIEVIHIPEYYASYAVYAH